MGEEKSTMEIIEENEKRIHEELGRMKLDDPNREKLLKEAKMYADMRIAYATEEETRLNNHARNDIDEEKLVIEHQKLDNEKKRMRFDLGKAAMYLFGGFASSFSSYMMAEWFQDYKPLTRFSEKVHDCLIRK